MREFLIKTSHSPRPLPSGRWQMTQRWNDLLFAHWPVSSAQIEALLPDGVEPDLFQGSAWLGVVPFWLDRIKMRGFPSIPGMRNFPDLNVRTYVRDVHTGTPGMYFFSLDATNLLAVAIAHTFFHLPYHWAEMSLDQRSEREFSFYSRRRFTKHPVIFQARYRGLGPTRKVAEARNGSLEYFLMERSSLFTRNRDGQATRSSKQNDLARSIGIELPAIEPVLHYCRRLAVYVWPTELVRPALAPRPVTVAATPMG